MTQIVSFFFRCCFLSSDAMSTFLLIGFFGLANGRRVPTVKVGREGREIRIYHMHYDASLQCSDGSARRADLRIYSPINNTVLIDNTIAFVIAKTHVPQNGDVLL